MQRDASHPAVQSCAEASPSCRPWCALFLTPQRISLDLEVCTCGTCSGRRCVDGVPGRESPVPSPTDAYQQGTLPVTMREGWGPPHFRTNPHPFPQLLSICLPCPALPDMLSRSWMKAEMLGSPGLVVYAGASPVLCPRWVTMTQRTILRQRRETYQVSSRSMDAVVGGVRTNTNHCRYLETPSQGGKTQGRNRAEGAKEDAVSRNTCPSAFSEFQKRLG